MSAIYLAMWLGGIYFTVTGLWHFALFLLSIILQIKDEN